MSKDALSLAIYQGHASSRHDRDSLWELAEREDKIIQDSSCSIFCPIPKSQVNQSTQVCCEIKDPMMDFDDINWAS